MTAERRATFLEYQELWMSAVMRRLPVAWSSAIGAYIGGRVGRRAIVEKQPWIDELHKSLERLCGVHDPVDRERRILQCTQRIGRVYAEFPVLQRIVAEGRLEVVGQENLQGITRPAIFASCHLGNWELVGKILADLPDPACALYDPPENPIRNRLATRARQAWMPDFELVPASPRAAFQITRALVRGKNLLLYVDEEKDGYVWAPRLGREIPYAGNRWMAARLAVRHDADIVPVYVEQTAEARYRLVIEEKLQRGDGTEASRARGLADQLEQRLDDWIRARPEQWYWLPSLALDKPLPKQAPARR